MMVPQLVALYGEDDNEMGVAPAVLAAGARIVKGIGGAIGKAVRRARNERQKRERAVAENQARAAQLEQARLLDMQKKRKSVLIGVGVVVAGIVVIKQMQR